MVDRKTASSDGTTPVQDAPPKDEKAAPVEEDITSKGGALDAVRPAEPVEALDADADYVEYKGRGTVRRITAEQWELAKIPDQGEVVWDASNNYKVPVSDLNDKALAALLHDGSFALPEK